MLLTPAFRNMDATLEEAGRTSGASNFRTALRVTLPLMTPAIVLVFMLKLVRMFQGFEIEQILGDQLGFLCVLYEDVSLPPARRDTRIWTSGSPRRHDRRHRVLHYPRSAVAHHPAAVHPTVTGSYKPGVIDLGKARPFVFAAVVVLVAMLSAIPVLTLLGGSFMTRVGFFEAIHRSP